MFRAVAGYRFATDDLEGELERRLSEKLVNFDGSAVGATCFVDLAYPDPDGETVREFDCTPDDPDDPGAVFTHEAGEPGYPRLLVRVLNGRVTSVESKG